MQVTIDRIEGEFAVVELPDMSTIDVPLSLFENPKEGMVFDILRNENEENKRKEKIKNLMEDLFE